MVRASHSAVVAAALVSVAGGLAWVTGTPFIFPSLGPTAYLLATQPASPTCRPRRVVGGHAVGAVAGLAAVSLFTPDVAVTGDLAAFSPDGLRIAASGVVATGLTAGGMELTDLRHAPACATTLIVSLGLLSTALGVGIIIAAVSVLVGVFVVGRSLWRRTRAIPQKAPL